MFGALATPPQGAFGAPVDYGMPQQPAPPAPSYMDPSLAAPLPQVPSPPSGMIGQPFSRPANFFEHNQQFVKPGVHSFNTPLSPGTEHGFRQWLAQNQVPFDPQAPVSDYDMRGFYQALQNGDPRAVSAIDPNDNRLHYPDFWKTPYHRTFSNQSQWATEDAPRWTHDDKLVTKHGVVLFDDRAR